MVTDKNIPKKCPMKVAKIIKSMVYSTIFMSFITVVSKMMLLNKMRPK